MRFSPRDRSGAEVAYAETTVDANGLTNTSYATIPNLASVAFKVVDRPVKVELFIPLVQVSATTSIFGCQITSADGLTIYASTEYFPGVAFAEGPILISRRITTPGDYVLIGRSRVTAGNYGLKPSTYSTPLFLSATTL